MFRSQEIDITKENLFKWGYSTEYYFYEDGSDSEILYLYTQYIPELLKLANDPNCLQHEEVHDSLYEMVREAFRDRLDKNINIIQTSLAVNPTNPWVQQWQEYIKKLSGIYYSDAPISESLALKLAESLIINKVEEPYNIKKGEFKFTGRMVSEYSEIRFSEGYYPGFVEDVEYLYVNLSNAKWEYEFMYQLDEIKI